MHIYLFLLFKADENVDTIFKNGAIWRASSSIFLALKVAAIRKFIDKPTGELRQKTILTSKNSYQ